MQPKPMQATVCPATSPKEQASSGYSAFRTVRGIIQIIILVAVLLLPISLFYSPGHMLTASGLLFDIAGVLRLFLLEEIKGCVYRKPYPGLSNDRIG
jgi:hypothetical protein